MSNRKTVRSSLYALLTAGISSAQVVYGYGIARLAGQTPVVCVTSAGSSRQRLSLKGSRSSFRLDIHIFVLFADGASWTEASAEDTLDDIEQQVATVIDANARHASWDRMVYAGASDAQQLVTLEGFAYRHEIITVEIQEYS